MKVMFILIMIIYIVQKSLCCEVVDPCLPSRFCGSKKKSCSKWGRCIYDVFEFFNTSISKNNLTAPCVCNIGYATYPDNADIDCCYKQSSQTIAFLLEFFIGFGTGFLYIGRTDYGCLKFFLSFLICCGCYTILCCFHNVNLDRIEIAYEEKSCCSKIK